MAGLLTKGGVLVVEEWGLWSGLLLVEVRPDAAALYARYQDALLEVFRSAGNDPTWGVQVGGVMQAAGLAGVEVIAEARSWRGGTAGCQLPVAVSGQLRDRLVEAGLHGHELDDLADVMLDPRTLVLGNVTISTSGVRA